MRVERTDPGAVGRAAAVENACRLWPRRVAENPQTDRNRVVRRRTVEHAGGGVRHSHIADPRETQRAVPRLTAPSGAVSGKRRTVDRAVVTVAARISGRGGIAR